MEQQKAPTLWKESTVVQVARLTSPESLNRYRPMTLTSLVMKTFEQIVKNQILAVTLSQAGPPPVIL